MRAILNEIINILFAIVGSDDRLSHEYMQPISYRVLVVPSVANRQSISIINVVVERRDEKLKI
jgi:hypothetical protein